MSMAPILVIPFSIKFFHEKVDKKAIGGAVIAIMGVAILILA